MGKKTDVMAGIEDTWKESEDDLSQDGFAMLIEQRSLRDQYIEEQRVVSLDPQLIHPDPSQPRKEFDEGTLKELAESIDSTEQSTPIKIYYSDKHEQFEVLFGESRYRAVKDYCKKVDKVQCIIVPEPTEEEKYDIRVDENERRKSFTVEERVEITLHYKQRFESQGIEQVTKAVADKLQISSGMVSQRLMIAKAMRHEDQFIDDSFKRLVKSKNLQSITTLYHLAKGLVEGKTARKMDPARDLVLMALAGEEVSKKAAEKAGKQATGGESLPYSWRPRLLRKDEGDEGDQAKSEVPEADGSGAKPKDEESPGQNEAKQGEGPDSSGVGSQTNRGTGQGVKPRGRVIKKLECTVSENDPYMKIKANSGFITKKQAIEFAEKLKDAAMAMPDLPDE